MKVSDICKLLDVTVVCDKTVDDPDLTGAFASDLMSDVLAYAGTQEILITGLANPQVIRTAEMLDMRCIILVRGKKPSAEMIRLAEENEIILLYNNMTMYETCGKLFTAGVPAREI